MINVMDEKRNALRFYTRWINSHQSVKCVMRKLKSSWLAPEPICMWWLREHTALAGNNTPVIQLT